MGILESTIEIYLANFEKLPAFILKACLMSLSLVYTEKIFELPINLDEDKFGHTIDSCFKPEGFGNVRVNLKHFKDFHQAFDCLNTANLLQIGIVQSNKENLMPILKKVHFRREDILSKTTDDNTLIHLCCRFPEIGIEVLQKVLSLTR